ncbi:DUF5686 family protein [soil metagenome]
MPLHFQTLFRTRFLAACFLLLCLSSANAQETKVSGRVYDPLTNEDIPFAAIVFKGTTIGANSDISGNYTISTMEKVDSISATFVGYLPVTLPVQKGKTQTINFALRVNKFDLPEVSVKAGENPADLIMREVRRRKQDNDRTSVNAYQYESYNKMEFDINNITEKFKKQRVFKPFSFIFDNIDSSATNKMPFLPVFLSETLSDIYFTKDPKHTKEIVKASKISGIENNTVSQYLGDFYQHINVYDNYVYLLGKGFVSPLSDVGPVYYKYYLLDSAYIKEKWCYKLKFKPRRKQELTFTGEVWIHDTTFAVKKISMRIADDANLNFIEDLAMVDEYDFVENKQWMLSKEILVMNIAPRESKKKETMGFIARKTNTYRNFLLDNPKPESFFADGEEVTVLDSANRKDESFWQQMRHDSLTASEERIYAMVDTLENMPLFNTYLDVITFLATGYYEAGPIDIGQLFSLYSYNTLEGSRVRLGGRTNNKFSKAIQLKGYCAYGFKDSTFKYSGGFEYFFDNKNATSFGASYKKDVEQLGKQLSSFESDNLLVSVLSRMSSSRFSGIEQEKFFIESYILKGLNANISLFHRNINSLSGENFNYYADAAHKEIKTTINASEVSLTLRYAYKERFIESGRKGAVGRKSTRIALGSLYPITEVTYTAGLKDVLGSDLLYHKLRINITDNLYWGNFGYTGYEIEAGKIWGTIPYPLLEVHKGNETYTYSNGLYNQMNYFEFVSDEFASASAVHHFGGLFFDRFPLLRKLKLREVVEAKVLMGRVGDRNRNIMVDQTTFNSLEKPYVEGGIGIENILKFGRIDLIKRFTHVTRKEKVSDLIRISLVLDF